MHLFKEKESYTIIADRETVFRVDEFIDRFERIEASIILDSCDTLAAFAIRSRISRDRMLRKIIRAFEPEFNVIPGNHIFCVVKKIGA